MQTLLKIILTIGVIIGTIIVCTLNIFKNEWRKEDEEKE